MSKNANLNNLYIKCAGCDKKSELRRPEWNEGKPIFAYKGSNNSELCHKCGENVCYCCGKKGKQLISVGENISQVINMFRRFEKDENNPSGGWYVCYCDDNLPAGVKKEVKPYGIQYYDPLEENQPNSPLNDSEHEVCALWNCGKVITEIHKGGKGHVCVDCNKRFCSYECINNAPKCKKQDINHNQNNKTLVKSLGEDKIASLIKLFKDHNISKITLNLQGNLSIEYSSENNDNQSAIVIAEQLNNNPELQNYLQVSQNHSLTQQELNTALLNNSYVPTSNPDNNKLELGLTIGGTSLIIGLFVGLLIKKRTAKKIK